MGELLPARFGPVRRRAGEWKGGGEEERQGSPSPSEAELQILWPKRGSKARHAGGNSLSRLELRRELEGSGGEGRRKRKRKVFEADDFGESSFSILFILPPRPRPTSIA